MSEQDINEEYRLRELIVSRLANGLTSKFIHHSEAAGLVVIRVSGSGRGRRSRRRAAVMDFVALCQRLDAQCGGVFPVCIGEA